MVRGDGSRVVKHVLISHQIATGIMTADRKFCGGKFYATYEDSVNEVDP